MSWNGRDGFGWSFNAWVVIEIGSFGSLTLVVGIQEVAGLSLITHGFSQTMIHSHDISFPDVFLNGKVENNPFDGPVGEDIFIGDADGNIIPVPKGNWVTGLEDGEWTQVKEPSGAHEESQLK